MIRLIVWWVLLVVVYALVISSFAWVDLAVGAVLAAFLMFLFRQFLPPTSVTSLPGFFLRTIAFFPFVWAVFLEILGGSFQTAFIVLGLRRFPPSGVIAIPVGDLTSQGVAVFALAVSLSPGSFYIGTDWEKCEMYFHVLDASHPERLREHYQRFYERYQKPVFP